MQKSEQEKVVGALPQSSQVTQKLLIRGFKENDSLCGNFLPLLIVFWF
jgi:hypothetical protein